MRPLSYETLVQEIVDEHSPQKQKYLKKESPPFMYSELWRAIYKKKMLFYKHKNIKEKQIGKISENKEIMLQN